MADREQPVTLRTRKFIRNPLLGRKQMVVDVLHPNRANVSKDELRTKLGELYKANKESVSCFGFRTQYGGGKSTGFALIYDSPEALKKFEPHYRLVRYGVATKVEKASRQQREFEASIQDESEADLRSATKASNGRTEPRQFVVQRKQKVQRRTRRNKNYMVWTLIMEVRLGFLVLCPVCQATLSSGLRSLYSSASLMRPLVAGKITVLKPPTGLSGNNFTLSCPILCWAFGLVKLPPARINAIRKLTQPYFGYYYRASIQYLAGFH
ncbi:MAG: hypothetical protein Q9214_001390 [Letrouitia sp. 1 TL-2023]